MQFIDIIVKIYNLDHNHTLYIKKDFYIPESFNTNISHQLFDFTITFVYQKAIIGTFHTSFFDYIITFVS